MRFLTRLALGVVLVVPGAATAQQQQAAPQLDAGAWREDLRVLATELPKRHRNAFARMKRESWDSAVAALDARIPGNARLRD